MKYLILALISLTAFTSDFTDDPMVKLLAIDSDSGIHGPKYSKIVEELKSLEES
jgi:hypothetical protein